MHFNYNDVDDGGDYNDNDSVYDNDDMMMMMVMMI